MGTKISSLADGSSAIKTTDLHVAVDTTDTSMAPTGTDKKYTWNALKADVILNSGLTPDGLVISNSGSMSTTLVPSVTSIQLQTTGGTASSLNFYQDYTLQALTLGGSFTSGTVNAYFSRIGQIVSCKINAHVAAVGAVAQAITLTGIPTQFRPTPSGTGVNAGLSYSVMLMNNSTYVQGLAHIELATPDTITLVQYTPTNFTSTSGFLDLNFTWPFGV